MKSAAKLTITMRAIVAMCAIALIACVPQKPFIERDAQTSEITKVNLDVVRTKGDHSYVPLPDAEFSGTSITNVDEILSTLHAFETKHPEFRIIGWKLNSSGRYALGIWIDHEPRDPNR